MRAAPILALLVLAAVPGLGSADFHPICTGIATAYANVNLEADASGSTFTYSGIVNCPSSEVTITSLELWHVPSYGAATLVANATGTSCADSPCTLADTAAAGPGGTYEVRMMFDVDDPATSGVDYQDVPRHASWTWHGVGQPVVACASVGFFPLNAPPGC